jgi:hypothetical protein
VKKMNGFRISVRMSHAAMFSATAGIVALLLLGAAGASPARAQQVVGGVNAAKVQQLLEARANMQAKNLGLNPDQTKQLVQINSNALQQLKALRTNPPADKMEAAKALKSIVDTRKAALRKLLTPEQMRTYTDTNQKDLASLMTLSLDSDLTLTNDQMKSTDQLNLTYIRRVSSALNTPNKVQAAQALKAAEKDYDSALQKVLTPEQWKQYQALSTGEGDKQPAQ